MFAYLHDINDALFDLHKDFEKLFQQLSSDDQRQLRTQWSGLPRSLTQPGELQEFARQLWQLLSQYPLLQDQLLNKPLPTSTPDRRLDDEEELILHPDGPNRRRILDNEVVRPTLAKLDQIQELLAADAESAPNASAVS